MHMSLHMPNEIFGGELVRSLERNTRRDDAVFVCQPGQHVMGRTLALTAKFDKLVDEPFCLVGLIVCGYGKRECFDISSEPSQELRLCRAGRLARSTTTRRAVEYRQRPTVGCEIKNAVFLTYVPESSSATSWLPCDVSEDNFRRFELFVIAA
jgi:hypothetical protein